MKCKHFVFLAPFSTLSTIASMTFRVISEESFLSYLYIVKLHGISFVCIQAYHTWSPVPTTTIVVDFGNQQKSYLETLHCYDFVNPVNNATSEIILKKRIHVTTYIIYNKRVFMCYASEPRFVIESIYVLCK